MLSCPICVEKINKKNNKAIVCFHCQNTACMSCVKRYILESTSEAKCMYCHVKWDRRFMVNNLTKVFCDKNYREHRNQILYERCKCFLVSIHPILELKYKKEKLQEEYYNLLKEKRKLDNHIETININIELISKDIKRNEFCFIRNRNINHVSNQEIDDKEEKNKIQRPCANIDCLGFLDGIGFCPVCLKTTCLNCNIVKESPLHECLEEDVLNWHNLKSTTKPCPSCRTRIYKITGCDQMWCTKCNNAFSWSRGTIERGAIHNPHYFDWLFDDNVVDEINPINQTTECDERYLPNILRVRRLFQDDDSFRYEIVSCYRSLNHLREVEIPLLEGLLFNPDNLTVDEIYRKKLLPFLYIIVKNKNNREIRKSLEKYDYQVMCNLECVEILKGYIRQQTYLFHRLVSKTTTNEQFLLDYNRTRLFYYKAIEIFEKEYKKKYNKIKSKL